MNKIEKPTGIWNMLHKATGYSEVYCRKVITGNRSQNSKGGVKIMAKYSELIQTLDSYYNNDLIVDVNVNEIEVLEAVQV